MLKLSFSYTSQPANATNRPTPQPGSIQPVQHINALQDFVAYTSFVHTSSSAVGVPSKLEAQGCLLTLVLHTTSLQTHKICIKVFLTKVNNKFTWVIDNVLLYTQLVPPYYTINFTLTHYLNL